MHLADYIADRVFCPEREQDMIMVRHNNIGVQFNLTGLPMSRITRYNVLCKGWQRQEALPVMEAAGEKVALMR
jgi:hypothetical protein